MFYAGVPSHRGLIASLHGRPAGNMAAPAVEQIAALGLNAADVRHIILTLIDEDHVDGLQNFPNATVHVSALNIGRQPGAKDCTAGCAITRHFGQPQRFRRSTCALTPPGLGLPLPRPSRTFSICNAFPRRDIPPGIVLSPSAMAMAGCYTRETLISTTMHFMEANPIPDFLPACLHRLSKQTERQG